MRHKYRIARRLSIIGNYCNRPVSIFPHYPFNRTKNIKLRFLFLYLFLSKVADELYAYKKKRSNRIGHNTRVRFSVRLKLTTDPRAPHLSLSLSFPPCHHSHGVYAYELSYPNNNKRTRPTVWTPYTTGPCVFAI